MDQDQSQNAYSEFVKKNKSLLLLGLVPVIFLIVGLSQIFKGKQEVPLQFSKSSDTSSQGTKVEAATSSKNSVMIDVSGAVIHPGVYTLSDNARVKDAIIASGGFSDEANKDVIEKAINLAQKVSDGMKVYIPKKGESVQNLSTNTIDNANSLVSINSASLSSLDSLPNIGSVTAQKIIDNRPYSLIDELLTKKVVSKKVFDKIKEKISL